MLDTLQKMSGTTHKAFTNSKTVTRDMEKIVMKNEGKVSYTMSVQEIPVISYNDMAFISERNSIVFRAGDSPIWNRNETILPMSWRLFANTISAPGKEYTLQTIPTLSSAVDFDVRRNQPNFQKMLDHRMKQAVFAQDAMDLYRDSYGYDDYDIERLDPDNYSDEIMDLINRLSYASDKPKEAKTEEEMYDDFDYDDYVDDVEFITDLEENTEQQQATAEGRTGRSSFLRRAALLDPTESLNALNDAAKDESSNVYADGDTDYNEISQFNSYRVTDDFYLFLAHLDSWRFAKGRFDQEMYRRMNDK